MPRTVTLTPTADELAALTDATEDAQREPTTARYRGLLSLLGKLEPQSPTVARLTRKAATSAPKTTRELLAEHEPEIDAEIARRRSSRTPAHGGSL